MTQIHTNKYTEHVLSKPTTTSMRENKYANSQTSMFAECTNINVVAIEFSKMGKHEPSTSRNFRETVSFGL